MSGGSRPCGLTCSVLSNQRLPLLSLLPPPCSIWPATWLRYMSSETRGMTASRHTVKMLFWMERTDSRFTLSAGAWRRGAEMGVSGLGRPGPQNVPEGWDGLQSFPLTGLKPRSLCEERPVPGPL